MKHHPNIKYFVENVDFSDMTRDWAEVCGALGRPTIVNSEDYTTAILVANVPTGQTLLLIPAYCKGVNTRIPTPQWIQEDVYRSTHRLKDTTADLSEPHGEVILTNQSPTPMHPYSYLTKTSTNLNISESMKQNASWA